MLCQSEDAATSLGPCKVAVCPAAAVRCNTNCTHCSTECFPCLSLDGYRTSEFSSSPPCWATQPYGKTGCLWALYWMDSELCFLMKFEQDLLEENLFQIIPPVKSVPAMNGCLDGEVILFSPMKLMSQMSQTQFYFNNLGLRVNLNILLSF